METKIYEAVLSCTQSLRQILERIARPVVH